MNKRILTASILVLSVILIGIASNRAGANNSQAQSKIAVVSIPKIMAQSQFAQSMQSEVNNKRNESLQKLETLSQEMEQLKADLDTRRPGSADFINLRRQLIEKRAVAEAQKEFMQEDLMVLNKSAMERLYAKILETVRDIAQARGIDLVLDSDEVELPAPNINELTMMMQTHKVLFHASHLDITDDVIKTMDSQ